MDGAEIERDVVLGQLTRLLSSAAFRGADRSTALLRYLVERSLAGDTERLKEYTLGTEALGRGVGFDPRIDPIVRAEASRLRGRLERYYAGEGRGDPVIIELPKGAYVLRFRQPAPETPQAADRESRLRSRLRRGPVAWTSLAGLAMLAAFALGAWLAHRVPPASDQSLTMLAVQLQSTGRIGSEVGTDVVLAPDGSRVVFVSMDSAGVRRLRTRRFDGLAPMDLPGTDGARGPFWSPDGRWVGFWAGGQLQKVAIGGGSPVVLCNATDLLGASWSADGSIIAVLDATGRLMRVRAEGGTPVAAVEFTTRDAAPRWPQVLPGGSTVLYTALSGLGADRADIEVVSLVDGRRHVLIHGGTFGRYVAPGYLLYVNQGTLYAVHFDAKRLTTRGSPVPIVNDVAYSGTFGYAQISVSAAGLVAYRRAPAHGRVIVTMLDSAGRRTPLIETPGQYAWPALSPDGRHLVVSMVESGVSHLAMWTVRAVAPAARAPWSVAGAYAATWTRDGRFLVAGDGRGLLWISPVDGTARRLVTSSAVTVPWSFAPDDRRLAFASLSASTAFDLWSVAMDDATGTLHAGKPTPLLRSRSFETYPTFSPDGRWLAYASNASGSWEVYVRSMADSSATVQVSRGGGRVPRWSRTSRRLFFGTDDQRIMVAPYTTPGGRFVPRVPRQWTPVHLADTGVLPNFDLGVDDHAIVALLPAGGVDGGRNANHMTLILHLAEELRRRLR